MDIAFIAAQTESAEAARARLTARYGDCAPKDATVIVALGGDGLMLECLHTVLGTPKPVYGMNCGSVGFMMNEFSETNLPERIARKIGPPRIACEHRYSRGVRALQTSPDARHIAMECPNMPRSWV